MGPVLHPAVESEPRRGCLFPHLGDASPSLQCWKAGQDCSLGQWSPNWRTRGIVPIGGGVAAAKDTNEGTGCAREGGVMELMPGRGAGVITSAAFGTPSHRKILQCPVTQMALKWAETNSWRICLLVAPSVEPPDSGAVDLSGSRGVQQLHAPDPFVVPWKLPA